MKQKETKPRKITHFPSEAVDRHLKIYGHLPEKDCCKQTTPTLTPKEEKEFNKTIMEGSCFYTAEVEKRVKSFIATLKHNAIKETNDSWINQPANEHDERIRQEERERIEIIVREKTPYHITREYRDTDKMRDDIIKALPTHN